jgi:TldD protein
MSRELDEVIGAAVEAGAEYADARLIESAWHAVRTLGGDVAGIDSGWRRGLGVRVRIQGVWGFAAGTELGLAALRQLGQRAVALAMGGGLLLTDPSPLAALAAANAEWHAPVAQDPFAVSAHDKAERLFAVEAALRGAPAVRAMAGLMACSRETKTFGSSEGAFIVQERVVTGAGYRVFAETVDGLAERSFPKVGGQFGTGGMEVVDAIDLLGSAERIRDEATRLIAARRCPSETRDLILTGPAVAAILHETLGHLLEADRLTGLGPDGDGSPLDPSQLGSISLASPSIGLVADPTRAGGLGTFGFDDDGAPAAALRLVDGGRWVGMMADRATAGRLALTDYAASARASGFNRAPLVRMSNLDLVPGSHRLEDLIAETAHGLLVDTPWLVEVDPGRRRFRCCAEIGWLLEDGRRYELVRDVSFGGQVAAFWASCDAVCDASEQVSWGVPDCVRGQPRQILGIGHATSPARFRAVQVGEPGPVPVGNTSPGGDEP